MFPEKYELLWTHFKKLLTVFTRTFAQKRLGVLSTKLDDIDPYMWYSFFAACIPLVNPQFFVSVTLQP